MKAISLSIAALLLAAPLLSTNARAGEHAVSQVKKAFTVPVVKAKVGDKVTFKNDDDFAHNVFSLSSVQEFDLGSYKKGEARSVTLSKEGTIEVECAIHPEMKMTIEVSK